MNSASTSSQPSGLRRVKRHLYSAVRRLERDAFFDRDAHDAEFFSLFLQLFGRVAEKLEAARSLAASRPL
jgi:hypothetical protein